MTGGFRGLRPLHPRLVTPAPAGRRRGDSCGPPRRPINARPCGAAAGHELADVTARVAEVQVIAGVQPAAGRAVSLATAQYNEGVSDFLAVVDAERSRHAAEDRLVQSQTALTLHTIRLLKALGGGWDGGAGPR